MRTHRSGYERAVLLELWIGRIAAWTCYLAATVLFFIWTTGSRISIGGGGPMSGIQELFGCVVLMLAGVSSARCEYRAEQQLREIWQTDLATRGRSVVP